MYGCNLYSLLANKLLTIYEYVITNEKWVFGFFGCCNRSHYVFLIALCTKLLIESGMGGCNELQLSWFYVHG